MKAKHQEKREMQEKIKKFRKGQKDALDFLGNDSKKGPPKKPAPVGKNKYVCNSIATKI